MPVPRTRHAERDQRRLQAFRLRNRGHTWQDIADQLGYRDARHAHQDVNETLDALARDLGETVAVHRDRALARLDEMWRAAQDILERRHLRVSGGKVVRDEVVDEVTGETREVVIEDDMPALAALDRMLRVEERRARLLGLDAPSKVEATVYEYKINGINPQDVT